MVGKNSVGTPRWKPAGRRRSGIHRRSTSRKKRVYVATGNAYTEPAAPTSDAVVAIDLKTGEILWTQQVTPNDVFVVGCKPGVRIVPDDVGPDFDFGNSPILRTLPGGRRVLDAGPEVRRGLRAGARMSSRPHPVAVPRRQGRRAGRH